MPWHGNRRRSQPEDKNHILRRTIVKLATSNVSKVRTVVPFLCTIDISLSVSFKGYSGRNHLILARGQAVAENAKSIRSNVSFLEKKQLISGGL